MRALTDSLAPSNLRLLVAEVVELVDTLASGASGGNPVEVQVLSSAPIEKPLICPLLSFTPSILRAIVTQCWQ